MADDVTSFDGNRRRNLEGRINALVRRRETVRDSDPELAQVHHRAVIAAHEELVDAAEAASSSVRTDLVIGKLRRLQSELLDPLAPDFAAAAETGERIAKVALGDGRSGVAAREYLASYQYWCRAGHGNEERADDALGRSLAHEREYRESMGHGR